MTDRIDLRTEIDFRTERMTMADVMRKIDRMMAENPDREYWLDGDTFSILSALKVIA